jgi:DNA-binding Lrp family transcriptional regulator
MSELLKNSHRSDRELARVLGTSQPTVSRTREKLEEEGYINEYTVIPNFVKLGFQLAAITLVKLKQNLTAEELKEAQQTTLKDMTEKAPDEIILFNRGMGGGYTGVLVSFHKSYSEYATLLGRMKEYSFVDASSTLSFIVDLNDKIQYRYFTLSTLAKCLSNNEEEKAEVT